MSPFTLVPRKDWGDPPSEVGLYRLKTPVESVYFGYTRKNYSEYWAKESPGPAPNHDQTMKELRYIVKGDRMRLPETRYNFLIGNDGCVYEARGWSFRPHLPKRYIIPPYYRGIYITFIGDFSEIMPSDAMFKLREEFLKDAVRNRKIRRKFTLISLETPWKANQRLTTLKF